ncbi:MAG: hypothetical protein NT169_22835 [Chloroflexi bacterium]|nr:hypothetical protein [Chloroflexota bacterium]
MTRLTPLAKSPTHNSWSRSHRLALAALVACWLVAAAQTFEVSETSKVFVAAAAQTFEV